MRLLLTIILLAAPLAAQQDFLTADEADQIREAQEPDVRLQLYLRFARQRLDMVEQLLAKPKTGRSGLIHDTLEQYTEIIEAIDTFIDNSIRKQKVISLMPEVAKTEREMLALLEKFAAVEAQDKGRFNFVLDQAMETTRDSAELSEQDIRLRTQDVEAKEIQLRKEREELLTPQRKDELKKDQTKIEAEKSGTPAGKKRPSLYKPGEKPGEKPAEKAPAKK